MMSIEDDGKRMGVHVTNDQVVPWQGSIRWRLETLSGEALEQGEEVVAAKALADTQIAVLDFSEQVRDENCRQVVFICELWHDNQLLVSKTGTFCPNKHLALGDPELKASLSEKQGQLHISVSAVSLARFVELKFAGADAVFSDNYFDISAGKTVAVTCPLPKGMALEQARQALRMTSLYHSYM